MTKEEPREVDSRTDLPDTNTSKSVVDQLIGENIEGTDIILISLGIIILTSLVYQILRNNLQIRLSSVQILILLLIAINLGGGVILQSLQQVKVANYRVERPIFVKLVIPGYHIIHLLIISIIFNEGPLFAIFWIFFLTGVGFVIISADAQYRLSLAYGLFPLVFFANFLYFNLSVYTIWVIPILYLKIHAGYLIPPNIYLREPVE